MIVPEFGSPDLFIKIHTDQDKKIKDMERPTLTDFDLKSSESFGSEVALITGEFLKKCGSSCIYIVGIFSSDDSNYMITMSTDIVTLANGNLFSD